jgi:hypothetical protein
MSEGQGVGVFLVLVAELMLLCWATLQPPRRDL